MANQNVTIILAIGVIGVGIWILYTAFSNVINYPEAFFGGNGIEADGNNDSRIAVYTIFFFFGGMAVILYAIRRIRETKQKKQTNPST
jgi:divalent metal cation (Fe/Co/Zn/Cd) transporter